MTVAIDPAVPEELAAPLLARLSQIGAVETGSGAQPVIVLDQLGQAAAKITLAAPSATGFVLAERLFAVVAPFDTIRDEMGLADVQMRWQGAGVVYTTDDARELLPPLLGQSAATVVSMAEMIGQLEANREAIGIVPFDQLDPRFKVLTIDGVNVLSNGLGGGQYPLSAQVQVTGVGASLLAPLLNDAVQPRTNRVAEQLTTLIMTGVTAMSRATAARMERSGYAYPAEIIGPTLAAADITHISNEVPFLEDCAVNNSENNLVLCSDTTYWASLEAVGADIIGLSGNHVNDFGRDGARESIGWYRANNIPIYGSGLTEDEACAPLFWQDHGNTFAFIAALAFDPPGAWASATEPGACYYYHNKERILQLVRDLAPQVDIVSVELQYEETYNPFPTRNQVVEFRELREAGADIVSGVQSHVPQAQEPYGANDAGGPGVISYGLGNLFFDQMWSWATRTELYARYTIYQGRVLNLEILTGVLEDYAQPRWATPKERAGILQDIFGGAPARP